jgi:small-conductance mechanosensitive channel
MKLDEVRETRRLRQKWRRTEAKTCVRSLWFHAPYIIGVTLLTALLAAGVFMILVAIFTGRWDWTAGIIAAATMGFATFGMTVGAALAWPL